MIAKKHVSFAERPINFVGVVFSCTAVDLCTFVHELACALKVPGSIILPSHGNGLIYTHRRSLVEEGMLYTRHL